MEVRYSRDEFIKFHTGDSKQFAKTYCDEHPKESYGSEDFDACYYTIPQWAMPTVKVKATYPHTWFRGAGLGESTFDDIIKLMEE